MCLHRRDDLTSVLQQRTFWPSYNSPYFTGVTSVTVITTWTLTPLLQTCSTAAATPRWWRGTETGSHTTRRRAPSSSPGTRPPSPTSSP